jgi:hypothetical protein
LDKIVQPKGEINQFDKFYEEIDKSKKGSQN